MEHPTLIIFKESELADCVKESSSVKGSACISNHFNMQKCADRDDSQPRLQSCCSRGVVPDLPGYGGPAL